MWSVGEMLLCEIVSYYYYLSFLQSEVFCSLFPQHQTEDFCFGVHFLLLCFQRGKHLLQSAHFY